MAKKGFIIDLEKETVTNNDYRRVLYTASHLQLVLQCILPGDEIGLEVHDLDQFIRVDKGEATLILNGEENILTDGMAVIIPEGVEHNVKNSSKEPLHLYTIYTPPEHKDGLIEATKRDEHEEHFDGITTE